MPITRVDPTTTVLTSFADVGGALAWLYDQIGIQNLSLSGQVSTATSYANSAAGYSETARDVAIVVRDRLGDPGVGDNIDHKINTLTTAHNTIEASIGDVQDVIGTPPAGWPTLVDLTYDFSAERSVANIAQETFQSVQHGGNSLADIIGSVVAAVFGGGSDLIEIGKVIQQIWDAPPVDVLTEATAQALQPSQTLTIASGEYGYHLHFTVPAYWGLLSSDPLVYQPHIGVAAWRGALGTVGPVVLLATPDSQVYPRPPGALYLDVTLRPGITGTYRALRFLGL